jgi:hypothetical protein
MPAPVCRGKSRDEVDRLLGVRQQRNDESPGLAPRVITVLKVLPTQLLLLNSLGKSDA